MAPPIQPDPWAEAAKNYKPQTGGQAAPQATGPNEDWKMWQQQDTPTQPGLLDRMKSNFNSNTSGAAPGDNALVGGLKNFGAGGGDVLRAMAHPIRTAESMAQSSFGTPKDTGALGAVEQLGGPAARSVIDTGRSLMSQPMRTLGQLGTGLIAGEAGGRMLGAASDAAGAARTAALGDPNAAALRGLQVGARSPKALRTLSAVEGARPFLSGAQDMADLQSRVQAAKGEIWTPYNQALDAVGNNPVKGPDGMTTVRALEDERQQLSALNRGLKTNSPEAIQLAQQKGMTAAELLAREKTVQSLLDPELSKTGIDPQAIRKAFGQVSEVGGKVSGKSTLIEKPQPTGLGRMLQLSATKPLQAPGQVMGGLRDLIAGRPMMEAKPSDLGIKEGFAKGGPKPDFGSVTTTGQPPPSRGLLGPGSTRLPASPEVGGTPTGYRPPPIDAGTNATRLGRLLNATNPARELPMSSYNEIFPEQLPQGRLMDLIRESRKK